MLAELARQARDLFAIHGYEFKLVRVQADDAMAGVVVQHVWPVSRIKQESFPIYVMCENIHP